MFLRVLDTILPVKQSISIRSKQKESDGYSNEWGLSEINARTKQEDININW